MSEKEKQIFCRTIVMGDYSVIFIKFDCEVLKKISKIFKSGNRRKINKY